jgi:hypothetical protein
LSSPTATQTGQTTASGSVSTNEGNGTLYRYVSTNGTETAATIRAANLTTTVTSSGTQSNLQFTGLTASTNYYAHYVHVDAANNQSAVATSAQFQTAAPVAQNSEQKYTLRNTNIAGATSGSSFPVNGNMTDNGDGWHYYAAAVALYVRNASNVAPLLSELDSWTWAKRTFDGDGNVVKPVLANQTRNQQKRVARKLGGWTDGDSAHVYYSLFDSGTMFIWHPSASRAGIYDLWLFYADGTSERYDNGTGTPVSITLA